MKKILTCVPPALGLICQVLIIADLSLEVYRFFKPKKDPSSHSDNQSKRNGL